MIYMVVVILIAHYYIIFVPVEPMEDADATENEVGCQTEQPMLISSGTSTTAKIVVGMAK